MPALSPTLARSLFLSIGFFLFRIPNAARTRPRPLYFNRQTIIVSLDFGDTFWFMTQVMLLTLRAKFFGILRPFGPVMLRIGFFVMSASDERSEDESLFRSRNNCEAYFEVNTSGAWEMVFSPAE